MGNYVYPSDPYQYVAMTSAPSMPNGPKSVREEEEMTIYDVFRHLISKTGWDGMDFNEENARKESACKLIDRLEQSNIFGQIGLDVKEKA